MNLISKSIFSISISRTMPIQILLSRNKHIPKEKNLLGFSSARIEKSYCRSVFIFATLFHSYSISGEWNRLMKTCYWGCGCIFKSHGETPPHFNFFLFNKNEFDTFKLQIYNIQTVNGKDLLGSWSSETFFWHYLFHCSTYAIIWLFTMTYCKKFHFALSPKSFWWLHKLAKFL